jgi:hypothetical protein
LTIAKEAAATLDALLSELDDRSSAAWLERGDWAPRAGRPPETIARLRERDGDIDGLGEPRTPPETWLAQAGWRTRTRGGPMKLHERPRFA